MTQTPPVTELRSFMFMVASGESAGLDRLIGRLTIQEAKTAKSRSGLIDTVPEYGFRLLDANGNVAAEVAPGYWPFLKKVIETAAPLLSPACDADCRTEIGTLSVFTGDDNG